MAWLRRFVTHPGIEVCAGLLMAAASLWVLLELPAGADRGGDMRSAYAGLLALGAFVALRSLALLAESVELLSDGTRHLRGGAIGGPARMLGAVARHPAFEFTAAAVLVLAGVAEAREAWDAPALREGTTWCLGLIVVGLAMLGRSLLGLVLGTRFYAHGTRRHGRRIPALDRLLEVVTRPGVEVTIGLLVIGLVVFEWVRSGPPAHDAGAAMAAETTLLLFGLARVLRYSPHLFAALEVVGKSSSR